MNLLLFLAGIIAILIGLVHSILGEVLVFSPLRQGSLVPTRRQPPLRGSHLRIIWATWHVVTVFGFGFAAILLSASLTADLATTAPLALDAIALAMLGGSVLVAVATTGRHPGWIGLLAIAVLTWLA